MTGRPPPTARAGPATLLEGHDALLLDLDGVVYRGATAVPHAVESLNRARESGVSLAFVTNNAARPPGEVAEHLARLGLRVEPHDVVTSAQAGAGEVAARVPVGARVLAIGGPGVAEALRARGLTVVDAAADRPEAVLMGFGPDVRWRDLAEASYAVGAGALLVATNTDASIPTDQGIAPGNGTLVSAVSTATGVAPVSVAGKPFAPLVRESVDRVGARTPLLVGDRLDTDIEAGHRSGLPTLMVLTGVHGVRDLLEAPPHRRPTYLAADLRWLARPPSVLRLDPAERDGADPDRADPDGIEPVREACRAAWAAADSGRSAPPSDVEDLARLVRRSLEG